MSEEFEKWLKVAAVVLGLLTVPIGLHRAISDTVKYLRDLYRHYNRFHGQLRNFVVLFSTAVNGAYRIHKNRDLRNATREVLKDVEFVKGLYNENEQCDLLMVEFLEIEPRIGAIYKDPAIRTWMTSYCQILWTGRLSQAAA